MLKQILLIEDDNDTRQMLAKFLERRGVQVIQAATGQAGLDAFSLQRPPCVFLDVHLPDMDGLFIFEKLRLIDPKILIYFVTGSTDSFYFQKKVVEIGASGFMPKPLVLDEVLEVVNQISWPGVEA